MPRDVVRQHGEASGIGSPESDLVPEGWCLVAPPKPIGAMALMARVMQEGWTALPLDPVGTEASQAVLLFGQRDGADDHSSRVLAALPFESAGSNIIAAILERDAAGPKGPGQGCPSGAALVALLGARARGDATLSHRQAQCLALLAQGYRVQEIADNLSLSRSAVEQYMRAARDRLGARTRAEAVARALRLGLLARPSETRLPEIPETLHVMLGERPVAAPAMLANGGLCGPGTGPP